MASSDVDDQIFLSPKHSPVESPVYEEPSYIQPHDSSSGKEQKKFEKECYNYLLSNYVTDDELISQHDFADFLTEYCYWEGVCDKGETLKFEMLPSPVQIAFAGPLCEGESMCIEEVEESFGYVYKKGTYDETETQISDLCETIYPLVGKYVSSTPGEQRQLVRCVRMISNKYFTDTCWQLVGFLFQSHRSRRFVKRLMSPTLTLQCMYSINRQKYPRKTLLSCRPFTRHPSLPYAPQQTILQQDRSHPHRKFPLPNLHHLPRSLTS